MSAQEPPSPQSPAAPGHTVQPLDAGALAIRGFTFLFAMPLVLLLVSLPLVLTVENWREHRLAQYAVGIVALWIVAALVLLASRREPSLPGVRQWFGRLRLADVLVAAVMLAAATAALWGFGCWTGGPRAWHMPHGAPEMVGWVLLCISVGVCEEIIYRGYCLSRLSLALGGTTAAWLVQAAFYGLLHFGFGATWIAFTTGAGLFFGWLALWRRSLWPVVIVHVLVDVLAALHGQ